MIKDKLTEAIKTSLENIKNGDEHIPLNMRGELEVIVRDRDGNVISYERGHNQVTNLAKMTIIHLLAGEIGVVDGPIYSTLNSHSNSLRGLSLSEGTPIVQSFTPGNHTVSTNADGQLVSEMQYFYDGSSVLDEGSGRNLLSQVMPTVVGGNNVVFNFPTKMLFGTGLEAANADDMSSSYQSDFDTSITSSSIYRLNGWATDPASSDPVFENVNITTDDDAAKTAEKLTNWYSNSAYRCRTFQPASTNPIQADPNATDVSIKGAIKNSYITSTSDTGKYNPTTKMAYPTYRGMGYPCFIYARRSTNSFYNPDEGNAETHYQMNSVLGTNPYETQLTYSVIMPAQPVNSTDVSTFYPYNGWILRQAGLFCDARYKLRSEEVGDGRQEYKETSFVDKVNGDATDSDSAKTYRDSVCGQMLFTRNLSSPILKTADTQVEFKWHIFVTI